MKKTARVVIYWEPKTLSDFRQACGRGARDFFSQCPVELVVPADSAIGLAGASGLEQHFEAFQQHYTEHNAVKAQICSELAGKVISHQNADEIAEA